MIILPDFRIHQRDYLLKISRAITAQLDLNEVLRLVLEASLSMLSGEVGVIALRAPDNHLRVQATLGVAPDQVDLFQPLLELGDSENGELDHDALKMRMRLVARKLNMNLRQVVSLPMRISGEMLGIIYVFRAYPGAPTPDDHMILQSFADQAAIAVHNAGLYQAIIAEKQRLQAILDGSGDGIIILDADLRVMRMNPALSSMTGWRAEYALGRLHEDVIRWASPEPALTLEKATEQGWPYRPFEGEESSTFDYAPTTLYVEGNIERMDGRTLSVGIAYAPLFFKEGGLRNIIANLRDITRFREAEEMKSTFISVVSHELKTPVALIKGYAGTLRRDDAQWDAQTVQRGLSIIEEEADRLNELIENLLMASKLQVEGILHLDIDDVALDRLVASAVERFKTQTDRHTFKLDFPPDFPCVLGDPKRLRHVIENLISNAIKYSPEGGDITLSGQFDENELQVSVADQGLGLRPEEAERIFERFYRANDSVARATPGTGLGLYLARAIIEAHGGRIWAVSDPGRKGMVFTFILPRQHKKTDQVNNNLH